MRREIYKIDDVTYEIQVEREEGAYWGCWTCLACEAERGSSSKRCSSQDEAILAAKTNLGGHHGTIHRRAR